MNSTAVEQALQSLTIALTEDGTITANSSVSFSGNIYDKGFYWAGSDYTKKFVMVADEDRLFSSETIDIARNKHLAINGNKVLAEDELGRGVLKSNLREVGRLKGLIVDGSVSINQYVYFDANSDRLGVGTEEPNAALSVAEDGIEVMVGTEDFVKGFVGTFGSHDLEIKTDNVSRISVKAGGDITLGNANASPIKVSVNGKLAIGVNNPDSDVDLHVRGAIKFNDKKHLSGTAPPTGGQFNQGDIVWNSAPAQRGHIGWVCVRAGNPGNWAPFGDIR
jgi:hypothetical protein